VRASITKLGTRIKDLEGKADQESTMSLAQQAKLRLEQLDSEFKAHHYGLVDAIDDEEALEQEQAILDEHDDNVSMLSLHVQQLIMSCSSSSPTSPYRITLKRLLRLKKTLSSVNDAVDGLGTDADSVCLLCQHQEQLADLKKELSEVDNTLLSLNLHDNDQLLLLQAEVEQGLFDCSLKVKKTLRSQSGNTAAADGKGVKLPKLEVPTFDGDILSWRSFWEQFSVSVHSKLNLSDAEKLVYLQLALKGGSAKQTIEGLSRTGDCYAEAVRCLQDRYDRPRLIHQTHVRMILNAPPLKDGSGRELRKLHDTVLQHLRALKAMGYEPSGPFITSALELKLDTNTMFEWQKHSQDCSDVPHFQKLLEFINLRAQASEVTPTDAGKRGRSDGQPPKKFAGSGKPVASFVAGTADPAADCVFCKAGKHPLYVCPKFKS